MKWSGRVAAALGAACLAVAAAETPAATTTDAAEASTRPEEDAAAPSLAVTAEKMGLPVEEVRSRMAQLLRKEVDADGDGNVSTDEVAAWLDFLHEASVIKSAEQRLTELDSNRDGSVDLAEVTAASAADIAAELSEEEKRYINLRFLEMDTNKDGALGMDELFVMMDLRRGDEVAAMEARVALGAADTNADGALDRNEFGSSIRFILDLDQGADLDAAFDELDENKDGQLTEQEIRDGYLGNEEDSFQDNYADYVENVLDDLIREWSRKAGGGEDGVEDIAVDAILDDDALLAMWASSPMTDNGSIVRTPEVYNFEVERSAVQHPNMKHADADVEDETASGETGEEENIRQLLDELAASGGIDPAQMAALASEIGNLGGLLGDDDDDDADDDGDETEDSADGDDANDEEHDEEEEKEEAEDIEGPPQPHVVVAQKAAHADLEPKEPKQPKEQKPHNDEL